MFIKPIRAHATAGVTLVELMFAIPIGMIAMVAVLSFASYTGRSFAALLNYADLEQTSRNALDTMTSKIRGTSALTGFTTNSLTFKDADGKSLAFTYDTAKKTLVWTKDSVSTTLLTGCDQLDFDIYQRCSTNGTFDQYPTSLQASNTKVVQVSWLCSRPMIFSRLNTQTAQSSKIVLRNQ